MKGTINGVDYERVEPNPFNLCDGILPDHFDLTWYVMRSATRREGSAERSLTNRRIAFYMPRLTRWSGRSGIKVRQSLFEGYGFVGLTAAQSYYELPKLEGVHGVISFGAGKAKPADFALISTIVAAEQAGHFDRTIPREALAAFETGEAVQVVDGKFSGFGARFARMSARGRVKVLLLIFGRDTLVEVDIADIRKAA